METFSLNPRSWRIFRVIGRNPLLRRCDRVEALVTLVAVVGALIAIPVAGLAGSVVYTARERHYSHELSTGQVLDVTAATTEPAASDPAVSAARRPSPAAGDEAYRIRSDTAAELAVADAATAVFVIVLGVPAAMALLVYATRRRVDQARDAQWERDIRYLQSGTGRSNQQ